MSERVVVVKRLNPVIGGFDTFEYRGASFEVDQTATLRILRPIDPDNIHSRQELVKAWAPGTWSDAGYAEPPKAEQPPGPCSANDPIVTTLPGKHKRLRYVSMPYGKETMPEVEAMAQAGVAIGRSAAFYLCDDCHGIFAGNDAMSIRHYGDVHAVDGIMLAEYGRKYWAKWLDLIHYGRADEWTGARGTGGDAAAPSS